MTFPQFGKLPSRYKKIAVFALVIVLLAIGIGYLTRGKPVSVILKKVERGTVEACSWRTDRETAGKKRRACAQRAGVAGVVG
jgi:hypothetical protein